MPSLKRSETSVKKYGGKRDNLELTYAIEFLFQIKGIEFRKKHPDFVIPLATEFLSFARMNEKKLKKEGGNENHLFMKFLYFVAQPVCSNRIIMCSSIVIQSILLYVFTTEVVQLTMELGYTLSYEQLCFKVSAKLKTYEGLNLCMHIYHYFLQNFTPSNKKVREYLDMLGTDSIKKIINVMPYVCMGTDILLEHDIRTFTIGQKLCESIDIIFTSYMEVRIEPANVTELFTKEISAF
jgi:hypothetical protein